MRLRTALNEFKRDSAPYPGEKRTTTGAFSGNDDRLVRVAPEGYLQEFSLPLSGLHGIDRSRLGIDTPTETYWFDDLDTVRQHYYRETDLVETEYDAGSFTVHQYDLTLGRSHVTHVELRGEIPAEADLVAFLSFAPEGQETRIGHLEHESADPTAVEVYHRREHDYVTASTGLSDVRGQLPERFEEILDDDPLEFPRQAVFERYEDAHLSGDVVVTAPLEREGRAARTTLATRIADQEVTDREDALAALRHTVEAHATADDLRAAARERTAVSIPEDAPRDGLVRADLRVLDLLEASTGGRIAAPEFDPFFLHSGGYGYVWFRENARVAGCLLRAGEALSLDLGDRVERTARFCCAGQLADGTWPHRVWASDGSIAPGWANAKIEGSDDESQHQADQTATVTAFLATLLRERADLPDDLADEVRETIADAIDAMDRELEDDGLPGPCQNVWEDDTGRFTHTAAVFLRAYAAVARAPVDDRLRERAAERAEAAFGALDSRWNEEHGMYATRLVEGREEYRYDASTLALVDAFREYAAIEGNALSETDLDRLADHVSATLNGLHRNTQGSDVTGLVRYEGDEWRANGGEPKVWSLATAQGAAAAATLGTLLEGYGRDGEAYLSRASDLYELLEDDGPFATDAGYLTAQVFDDGTPDAATPLGETHALRLRTTALLEEAEALPTVAAPEGPGEHPRWTTGKKFGIGTVADHDAEDPSKVWFTLTEGALTEVRFPRIDLMNLRTLDFVIDAVEDEEYTVRTHNEDRRDDDEDTIEREVVPAADDALLFEHRFTETGDGRGHEWTLAVEYAADPEHDAVVAHVRFEAEEDYEVFAVADTALTNTADRDRGLLIGEEGRYHLVARDATAYTGEPGENLLVDEDGEGYSVAAAMATEDRFDWATVATAGSDHLAALFSGDRPDPQERVDEENVVLVGRLDTGSRIETRLSLGFSRHADTAAALGEAVGSLARPHETVREAYADTWRAFLEDKPVPEAIADDPGLAAQYRSALMTLLAVEDKTYVGASIASPSVPWGGAVAAAEPKSYGYNFVWSRDLYHVFTAFAVVGAHETGVSQLEYIYEYQQDERGFVPQNTYINGITRWGGEQMDNISFPQVMAYHLWQAGYGFEDVGYDYENVRRSADYVVRNGPETAQERWEEEAGYSPSSIAAEISGLVCAGKLAVETGHEADALVWFALADQWANGVESWTATESGTEHHDHTPYYVRVTRDGDPEAGHLRTLANDGPTLDERDVIDGGFLDLVRLGIKPADDGVIENSVAEVDDTIRVDLDDAVGFYRYNGDGYGERARGDKGAPWSVASKGKGRLWPLLSGERGEYELRGGAEDPMTYLQSMQRFANSGRMIPEQVWDREYGTDYNWELGEGTGSATPLAWSMAGFVRLAHGIDGGEPAMTPDVVRERYLEREIHQPDRTPALRVDTSFEGDTLVVSGATTGELVAVKTPSDTALVEPADGDFECRLDIEYGENTITVAAAADRDLERAGTTVARFTL